MSRTDNTIKNIKYSLIGQIIALIANFFARIIFVRILGAEYLGVNGLFSNILSVLSFAELGIGSAIIYSMYKPLAIRDIDQINGLMNLFKRAYRIIGMFILFVGLIISPFLRFFIKDETDINNLEIIFFLFLINTVSSYFFAYKRSLLISDQKKYIDSFYQYLFVIVKHAVQIPILIISRSFITYLVVSSVSIIVENILVSQKVDKLYPFLKSSDKGSISDKTKYDIKKNVKALFLHKIGSVVVMGTDNMLISKFVGLIEVGLYSNYLMIITTLKNIYGVAFQSILGSIGNLGATESTEKNEFTFRCIDLFDFLIYGFSSTALITLANPFITLWLGKEYIFPENIVLLIVISFYISGRRSSVLIYRDALGLFWYDRYKPILESAINFGASIYLVSKIGIAGVIIGTIISSVLTCFLIEPFVLYKFGFNRSVKKYYQKYFYYMLIAIVTCLLNVKISSYANSIDNYFLAFLVMCIITLIIPTSIYFLLFRKKREFAYLIGLLKIAIKH